jgi:2-polyprenyl-6-methoxyphenol hydroxylase-like FAD-dependent oxidoreductase
MSGSDLNPTSVPVLIVGAGAGGLATSALLAKHGVRSLLVEKRREVFIYPKARNLSFRSLEVLRGLGVGDEVHAVAQGVSAMVVKPALNSTQEEEPLDFGALFSPFDGLSPEPSVQYCPQSRSEPILLAATRRHGNDVRYATELSSFDQDASGVTAVVRNLDSGDSETVRADYLVAADGTHSVVSNRLGVTTSGYGALPIFVIFVYFRGPWRKFIPHLGDGDAVQVKNAEVDGIFVVAQGDVGMFITTYFPDRGLTAAQFTPQRCRELVLTAVGEPIDIQVIDVASWQPYEQVADQFQSERAFLVGDSAHTMPAFKAGGANVAIQSAHNLAWKLAAVIGGQARPALLDTYYAERHPVGRFSARQSLTGPTLGFLDLDDRGPGLPAEEERPLFAMLAGYRYHSAAVVDDDTDAADPDAVVLVEELHGQPGTRVPHAWVRCGEARVSTLDLLGPGFTLLTGDGGGDWIEAADSASAALGVAINVHRIGTSGDAVDTEGRWAAVTGLAPDGALLVRPDDFVGWRADKLPADPGQELRQVLSTILARGSD